VLPIPIATADDFSTAFEAIDRLRANGIIVADDALLLSVSEPLLAFIANRRLPAIYGHRDYAEAGGLMSYSANLFEVWRRAGDFVDKILKGAKPADLPIEQPTKFELIINMKAANALGLTIPPLLLARADEVIE
jgi:putative ABC transport system substrate-binding protein